MGFSLATHSILFDVTSHYLSPHAPPTTSPHAPPTTSLPMHLPLPLSPCTSHYLSPHAPPTTSLPMNLPLPLPMHLPLLLSPCTSHYLSPHTPYPPTPHPGFPLSPTPILLSSIMCIRLDQRSANPDPRARYGPRRIFEWPAWPCQLNKISTNFPDCQWEILTSFIWVSLNSDSIIVV